MPRKNPRPAAKKRAAIQKAKMAKVAEFKNADFILICREPRHGDAARMAQMALACGLTSVSINRGRY